MVERRKRIFAYVLAVAAALVVLAGVLIVVRTTGASTLPLPPGGSQPNAAGDPGTSLGPIISGGSAGSEATVGASPGASPVPGATAGAVGVPGATPGVSASGAAQPPASASASVSAAAEAADLRARYEAKGPSGVLGLSGYTAQVTISNPGTVTVSGWQVVISLPGGATVSDASGANAAQDDTIVTFTPIADTRDVEGGGTRSFTFEVGGLLAGQPTGCSIDGHACS